MRQEAEMSTLVVRDRHPVLEKVAREHGSVAAVGAEAGDNVPGEVDGPALDVCEGVKDGDAGVEGAAFAALEFVVPGDEDLEIGGPGGGVGGAGGVVIGGDYGDFSRAPEGDGGIGEGGFTPGIRLVENLGITCIVHMLFVNGDDV